jgi:hypothetical protein
LARSISVRAGVVIGMPRWTVVSSGVNVTLRCTLTPRFGRRPESPGTVTSITPAPVRRSSQAAAALA